MVVIEHLDFVTAQQFVAQNYKARLDAGDCRVYSYDRSIAPPPAFPADIVPGAEAYFIELANTGHEALKAVTDCTANENDGNYTVSYEDNTSTVFQPRAELMILPPASEA